MANRKLSDVRVKKAKNRAKSFLCMREQQSADRSSFDPRSFKDRTPMHFADIHHHHHLFAIVNGKN